MAIPDSYATSPLPTHRALHRLEAIKINLVELRFELSLIIGQHPHGRTTAAENLKNVLDVTGELLDHQIVLIRTYLGEPT